MKFFDRFWKRNAVPKDNIAPEPESSPKIKNEHMEPVTEKDFETIPDVGISREKQPTDDINDQKAGYENIPKSKIESERVRMAFFKYMQEDASPQETKFVPKAAIQEIRSLLSEIKSSNFDSTIPKDKTSEAYGKLRDIILHNIEAVNCLALEHGKVSAEDMKLLVNGDTLDDFIEEILSAYEKQQNPIKELASKLGGLSDVPDFESFATKGELTRALEDLNEKYYAKSAQETNESQKSVEISASRVEQYVNNSNMTATELLNTVESSIASYEQEKRMNLGQPELLALQALLVDLERTVSEAEGLMQDQEMKNKSEKSYLVNGKMNAIENLLMKNMKLIEKIDRRFNNLDEKTAALENDEKFIEFTKGLIGFCRDKKQECIESLRTRLGDLPGAEATQQNSLPEYALQFKKALAKLSEKEERGFDSAIGKDLKDTLLALKSATEKREQQQLQEGLKIIMSLNAKKIRELASPLALALEKSGTYSENEIQSMKEQLETISPAKIMAMDTDSSHRMARYLARAFDKLKSKKSAPSAENISETIEQGKARK